MWIIKQINLGLGGVQNLSDLFLLSVFRDLVESVVYLAFPLVLHHFGRCFADLWMVNLTANCSLLFLNNHILLHGLVLLVSLLVIKDFVPCALLVWS